MSAGRSARLWLIKPGDQVRINSTGETGEILEIVGKHIWVRVNGWLFDAKLPKDVDGAEVSPALNRWHFEAHELTVISSTAA
jgi:hypothetical protein